MENAQQELNHLRVNLEEAERRITEKDIKINENERIWKHEREAMVRIIL